VADGGKTDGVEAKGDDESRRRQFSWPSQSVPAPFVRKDAGRRRRCCLISSLFSSSSSSQVKKEIDGSDGLGQTSTVSVGWVG
jgi:hypothetical protein